MEIFIIDAGYKSYTFEKELFEKHGYALKIWPNKEGGKAEKRKFAENADGILVRHTQIDEEFLAGMKNLKALVRYGVGYDNVNVDDCTKFGVKFANVQGYGNHSVSDHALAMIMMCTRAMWDIKHQVTRNFGAPPVPDVFELHDKTLGIIGLGRIGSHLCKKAGPLFAKTIAADPYKPQEHFKKLNAEQVPLDELLQTADVISIHCNLTEETNHILNSEAFSKMGKKPIVVNTSRGEVIDEVALLNALNTETIHSAGIDVYKNEPVTEKQDALISHPRTICTGHYAWYSDRASKELQRRGALNLLNFLQGKPVEDCLNPSLST